MTRSAAAKAVEAADALLAWLDTQAGTAVRAGATGAEGLAEKKPVGSVASGMVKRPPPVGIAGMEDAAVQVSARCDPTATVPASRSRRASAAEPMHLPNTDWLHHRLSMTGPAEQLAAFRAAAAGSGTIPWTLDLDRLEEDWLHLLVSPPAPQQRILSVAGARIVAGQLREAVARRHELAVARVGRSRACPLDLHALLPIPDEMLRLGPDDPHALAWLWQHWGTTQALRRVTEDRGVADERQRPVGGEAAFQLTFWSADWTPWRALADLEQRWPTLRFAVRPTYGPA